MVEISCDGWCVYWINLFYLMWDDQFYLDGVLVVQVFVYVGLDGGLMFVDDYWVEFFDCYCVYQIWFEGGDCLIDLFCYLLVKC